MYRGLSVYFSASSARTTIAAAEPSATPEQSKTRSVPAMSGALQIVSIVTGLRNCARSLTEPFWWFFHEMRASTSRISSSLTPYFAPYAGAHIANIAAADSARAVPSVGAWLAPTRPWYPLSLTFSTPTAIATS